jgi:hypothetical protein
MRDEANRGRAAAAVWSWRREEGSAPAPDEARRVRRRGLVRGGIGLLVAGALALWKPLLGAVAAGIAVLLLAVALLAPGTLYPRLEGWIAAFARGVGVAVTWVTLTLVFVLVFLPMGLLLRATGRLRIAPGLDPEAPTYWRPADPPGRHERQF